VNGDAYHGVLRTSGALNMMHDQMSTLINLDVTQSNSLQVCVLFHNDRITKSRGSGFFTFESPGVKTNVRVRS